MKKLWIMLLCVMFCAGESNFGAYKFDWTKKGNVYENTFLVPYDIYMTGLERAVTFGICFRTSQTMISRIYGSTRHTTPWLEDLYSMWFPCLCEEKYNDECYAKCKKARADTYLKKLESHHPNQHFRFKLTFTPLSNPQEKKEEIIEFPLYYTAKTSMDILSYNRCIRLFAADTKFWRKYHIRFEVLEDTSLPIDIDDFIGIVVSDIYIKTTIGNSKIIP